MIFKRSKRATTACVVGAGPSGLAAAAALTRRGVEVGDIIARSSEPSPLYGAQYLHAPIPGFTEQQSRTINYIVMGTPDGYARRIYKDRLRPDLTVSAESLVGSHQAWDIRQTYASLWSEYRDRVIVAEVNADNISGLAESFDHIVFTAPAPAICRDPEHTFTAEEVWAAGEAPSLGIRVPYKCDPDTVVCNGLDEKEGPSWYRISNIFGHKTVEWPGDIDKPPLSNRIARVRKPLSTNCDCPPPNVIRSGRYGAWRKGVLVHEVYADILRRF